MMEDIIQSKHTILDCIEESVQKYGKKQALVFKEKSFTYEEIGTITDCLAGELQSRGIGKGDVVSILIPRCEYMLIGALGVLKAGAAYQPLDASHPFARIRYMIEDANSALVIVAKEMEEKLQDIPNPRFYMEDILELPKKSFVKPDVDSKDLFVLLYTSGSTGVPKGCMLEHGNLLSFCKWYVKYYEVDTTCVMGEHASFVFDVSMMELFMPLAAGAVVHIIPEEIRTDLKELNRYFEKNGVTHASITTQLGRQFATHIENHSLRHLTVAGEALVPLECPKNYQLHNGYGPTEGTILLTIQPVMELYEENVPIGVPLDEVEIYVLDQENKLVPRGEVGELCAAGPHITRGYLNQPEQTEKVFEKNPFSTKEGYDRIYHTGDLVRYREDGLLEYLGRADRQVKIRGYRIELPEVEAAMRLYEEIEDATVAAFTEENGEKYLVGYYVAKRELLEQELIDFVGLRKPQFMIPSYFLRLDEIPLNTNGKIDRNRLPVPDRSRRKEVYELPNSEYEEKIAKIFEKLLGIKKVGRKDDFINLGGHSLLATQLLFAMEKKFGCHLKIGQVLEHTVVWQLAELVERLCKEKKERLQKEIEPAILDEAHTEFPVSDGQERMYTAQKLCEKDDVSYNLPVVLHIGGDVSEERLKTALMKLLERHEVLRTSFSIGEKGLVQNIALPTEQWLNQAVEDAREQASDFVRPFLMDQAPLFRWDIRKEEKGTNIYLDWHHSISDGRSMLLFCKELVELYNGEKKQKPLFQYKDYAIWEKKQDVTPYQKAWREYFVEGVPTMELPLDKTRKSTSGHKGNVLTTQLSEEMTKRIHSFCRANGVTEYMFLFAVYFVLLQKYTRQEDLIAGTVMSGRDKEEFEDMQGMFVNTVPVLTKVPKDTTFLELLKQVKERILFSYDNQMYALEKIAKDMQAERTPSGNLLFDTLFVMQNFDREMPKLKLEEGDVEVDLEFVATHTSMYDLTVEVEERNGHFQVDFEYAADLFEEDRIAIMQKHYIQLIQEGMEEPEKSVSKLSMLYPQEQTALLKDFQGERLPQPEATVVELLEKQRECQPEKNAIIFGEETVTYERLWQETKKVADRISDYVEPDDFVAILAERSVEMLYGIWGTLMAGAAYVPVSPEYPKDRIQFILSDCKPKVIVLCGLEEKEIPIAYAREHHIPLLILESQDTLVTCKWEVSGVEKKEASNVASVVSMEQLAYMIYTSGTTGKPKGVMVEHRQLAHLIQVYTGIYSLTKEDCVLQFASFVFDQSVWDIFHILCVGGTLCVIPPEMVKEPEQLEEYCEKAKVTVASLTPGFLRVLHPEKLPSLRLLDVGGEAPTRDLLQTWAEGRTVLNTYGPTETTVNATSFVFDGKERNTENVPIGKPIPNTKIYILQNLQLCGIGVPGELCITGNGVTRGYLNREELNQEKFLANPFGEGKMYRTGDLARFLPDGNIEFLGRIDEQVKIRGYRMELGEIEAQMRGIEQVKEAVVFVRQNPSGEKYLCGYYTQNSPVSPKEIKGRLKETLPFYMVPSVCVPLEQMPLTINGKINKKALPEPVFSTKEEFVEAQTQQEKDCVSVWKEILQLDRVSMLDDFFELGGDSIKAIRVVARMHELGYQVEIKDIMEPKSCKVFAALLQKKEKKRKYQEVCEVEETPILQEYFRANMPHPEHYNQSVLVRIKEPAEKEVIEKACYALGARHGMLRVLQKGHILKVQKVEEWNPPKVECYPYESEEKFQNICTWLHQQIQPEQGQVWKVGMFQKKKETLVVFVVHHLAVDEVSWNIILEDFSKLYEEAKKTQPDFEKALPEGTVSFGEWSKRLQEYAESEEFKQESCHWKEQESYFAQANKDTQKILDAIRKEKSRSSAFTEYEILLEKEYAQALVKLSEKVYHCRMDALLLAFFMECIYEKTGMQQVLVHLESHGRGRIVPSVETDRTVGWFTAVYPFVVEKKEDRTAQILDIKERLLGVPNYGMGYGLYEKNTEYKSEFKPELIFNYLGQSESTDYGNMVWEDCACGQEIHEENGEENAISVDVRMKKQGLEFNCKMDSIYDKAPVQLFFQHYMEYLRKVSRELEKQERVYSPSDFGLGQVLPYEEWRTLESKLCWEDVSKLCVLTPLQQGMFYHWLKDKSTTAYVVQDLITIHGQWDRNAMKKSLDLLSKKHEALRLGYVYEGLQEPLQYVLRERKIPFSVAEEGQLEQKKQEELEKGFDLTKDPLFRVVAFEKEGEDTLLLITQHHIIMDGWSFPVVLWDLESYYREILQGAEDRQLTARVNKEIQESCAYSTYLQWRFGKQKEERKAQQIWQEYLSEYEEEGKLLPWSNVDESQKAKPEKCSRILTTSLQKKLQRFSNEKQFTMSLLFETIWGLILQFENNISDVVFGKTVSGREAKIPGIENTVGMMINTIPVRVKVSENMTLIDLLEQQRKNAIELLPYQTSPLSEIQAKHQMGSALIESLYVYENYYVAEQKDTIFQVETLHEETNYPITFFVEEGEQIGINILYQSVDYPKAQIEKLLERFCNVLSQLVEEPHRKIDQILRMTKEEQQCMLGGGSGREKDYPLKTALTLFREYVEKQPDKIAVKDEKSALTYKELQEQALKYKEKLGDVTGQYVVLVTEKSVEMLVAIFGVLYAGAAYVPVDPAYPRERISYILQDCKAKVVVTKLSDKNRELEKWLTEQVPRCISVSCEEKTVTDGKVEKFTGEWEKPAYMIYTSGTTGRPKGVVIAHKSLSNMIYANADFYGFCENDTVLQMANYVFDQSVWDIFNTLCCGGTLCLISKERMQTAEGIESYIKENQVTVLMTTTVMLEVLHPEKVGSLRLVDGGGDVAKEEVFARWKKVADMVVNSYGPTEATVNATAYLYKGVEKGSIPIGLPLLNKKIYIMQGENLCGIGQIGEICIAGKGLAEEYLNQRELTEEKFTKNPFGEGRMYRTGDFGRYLEDGTIAYHGRMDEQVKIRGYRIELGEIERRIGECEGIDRVAVVCLKDEAERNYLAAYLVGPEIIEVEVIRKALQEKLPEYMVPAYIQQLEKLPLNQSGKLDVKALPKAGRLEQTVYEEPVGYFEQLLTTYYERILSVDKVGRKDSFFALGGSSIDVMKLLSALSDYPIGIEDIIQYKTPERLGRYLQENWTQTQMEKSSFVVLREGIEEEPALICLPPSGGMYMCYLDFLQELSYKGKAYGIMDPKYAQFTKMDVDELWEQEQEKENMWEDTLDHYWNALQEIWRDGDILVGYSQGGSVAHYLARKIEKAGGQVGALLLLESTPCLDRQEMRMSREEVLEMTVQMYGKSVPKDMDTKLSVREILEREIAWEEEQLRAVVNTYMVVSKNVQYPLRVRETVSCPIYAVSLTQEKRNRVITPVKSLWEKYTNGECRECVIETDQEEHLVFLSKYKTQIAQILHEFCTNGKRN